MEWYYCECCGAVFAKEDIRVNSGCDVHWWLDDKPKEYWAEWLCPECGSACIEECEYCEYCGDPFKPGELVDGVCEECRKKE